MRHILILTYPTLTLIDLTTFHLITLKPDDLTLPELFILRLILTSCGQQQAMRGMLMKKGTSATKEQKDGWKAFKARPSQHK